MISRPVAVIAVCIALLAGACSPLRKPDAGTNSKTGNEIGGIVRLTPALDRLVPPGARIEILTEGFSWAEGPVWIEAHRMLLFTDLPNNTVYRWTERDGVAEYLKPSGYTGIAPGSDQGANGLLLDGAGRLVLCQHGDRRLARMDAPLDRPAPVFETIADRFRGSRFNSPNDAVLHSSGSIYFTDPPYGLPELADDPARELPFQGVFRVSSDGEVELLTDELTRPNGIALSPDEKTLYVANSDPERAIWMAWDLTDNGDLANGRVFFDATADVPRLPGVPDGLEVDDAGNLYATGPGGVLIFSPEGEHLGTIDTGQFTANVAFNADKSVLFITAHSYLMRVVLR